MKTSRLKTTTHIKPLYTCNLSYERKTQIWRLSFLIGGHLAPPALLANAKIAGVKDPHGFFTLRVYSGKWSDIAAASHSWMSKNKE